MSIAAPVAVTSCQNTLVMRAKQKQTTLLVELRIWTNHAAAPLRMHRTPTTCDINTQGIARDLMEVLYLYHDLKRQQENQWSSFPN